MLLQLRCALHRTYLSLICFVGGFDHAWSQIPTSELLYLSQQAAQVGIPLNISLHGNRLEELRSLLVTDLQGNSLPLDIEVKMAAKLPLRDWQDSTGEFSITSAPEQICGLVEIRAVGRLGASNSRTFLFTKIPVVVVSGEHNSMLTALNVEYGNIVNGQAVSLQSKFYRLAIGAREEVECVVYCRQIDSPADIHLRLLNADGRELSSARSSGYWPAEVKYRNSSDEATNIFIEVRDLLGRGGPQYGYLLECGRVTRPTVESSDSTNLKDSESGKADLHLNQLLRPALSDSMKRDQFLSPLSGVGTKFLSGLAKPEPGIDKPIIEIESLRDKVVSLTDLPVLIRGKLAQKSQINFSAKKGQAITFDVASAKFEQLTDPALIVYKRDSLEGGTQGIHWIGDSDDAAYCGTPALRLRQTDPNWVWTAPEDGLYQLQLVDNQSGNRPNDAQGFLLELRSPKPGFSLVAYRAYPTSDPAASKPMGNGLMRYGTDWLHVTLLRRDGFTGAVELFVLGLPEKCVCHPVIVQPGATEATLVIQASDIEFDRTAFLTVVGKALESAESIEEKAISVAVTVAATPTYNAVLSRISGGLDVTTVSTDIAPLQVSLGDGQVIEGKPESKLNIPLRLRRGEEAAAECIVRPYNLPPKISVGEIKIPADQREVSVDLTIPADMPVGEYTFWVLAESKVKWQVNPQALEREQQYLAKLQAALGFAQPQGESSTSQAASRSDQDNLGQNESEQDKLEKELASAGEVEVLMKKLEAAVVTTTQRIEQLKTLTAQQEITVWIPSNTARLRISP